MAQGSVWFVPRNKDGGYHVAIQIVREGEGSNVFVRSGFGKYDWGIRQDLYSLMDAPDIRYITDGESDPLPFEKAVDFMKKQTAFRMVE